jgi:hypothetical protein
MENPIAEISRNPTKIETLFWRVKWAFVEWFNKHILRRKSNTHNIAKRELDILKATTPDAIVTPFAKEILALCEAFGNSGQSGGSAPYTASAISQAVKKLMLHEPICDVTGHESEWVDVAQYMGKTMWQNSRCGGLFKDSNGKCSYNDAIVWKGEEGWDTFTGRVYIDEKDFELIGSSQYAKFPFKPKTFYIDVVRVPITKEEAESRNLHYIEDGFNKCYYTILKDPTQLAKVFKYYDKK